MAEIEYNDIADVSGFYVLDVMRRQERGWDWTALMVDVDPDSDDFKFNRRPSRSRWLLIAGKHRSRDAAYDALEAMLATRH